MESAKQKGKGMAQDLLMISSNWGFELSDVQDVYEGSIHIFQGVEDNLVPASLQRYIKNIVSVFLDGHCILKTLQIVLLIYPFLTIFIFQLCVQVPDLVHLHELEGEGHISAFCNNDQIHRETLECLFGGASDIGEVEASSLDMKSGGVEDSHVTEALKAGTSALDSPYIL